VHGQFALHEVDPLIPSPRGVLATFTTRQESGLETVKTALLQR
jgi:hypothetical protein